MGNYHMTIKNETPDYYSYCYHYHPDWEGIRKHAVLPPYTEHDNGQRQILTTLYVKYGHENAKSCRDSPMLQRYYNGIYNPRFYIRPIGDKIRLCCSLGGDQPWCDNLGERERQRQRHQEERRRREEEERRRREEERRRRQEEEERRRRERIERERRIQEQISQEAEALKNRLGRASERRRLQTSLSGREQQHQRSQVLAQTIEDDAEEIKYEEEETIETNFQTLLNTHCIKIQSSDGSGSALGIRERVQMLYDQLISRYCAATGLSIWSHFSFDEAIQFNCCSLTDKLQIVEALIRVILKDENADLITDIKKDVVVHDKHALLILLMASLKNKNRSLCTDLLGNCLDAFAGMSQVNKEYIKMVVFNNIWTPLEAIIFLMWTTDIPQDDLTSFLHMVQTYRVGISEATIALKSKERLKLLQDFIDDEEDKSLITVIKEMRKNGLPEKTLRKVEQVVQYVVSSLRSMEGLDITDQIENGIQTLKKMDFKNFDISELGKIMIGLSIAVKQEMGYLPRVTQLVSVVTLLLSKTSELKGCLLEISTGEGKSCVIAMLAVILALRGCTVDIVTSSPVLAMRDVEEWGSYFAKFNLTAGAAVPIGLSKCKTQDERDLFLASVYKSNVVYGTVGNFAADILRQEFEKKNIRGDRKFDVVIVDEVDYMTLDNGVQVTFLSHAASGMRHIEQVLASIWNMVCACRPVEVAESGDMFWFTNVQHFHKAVVSALVGSEANENFNAWEVLKPALNLGFITVTDFENLATHSETMIAKGEDPETAQKLEQSLTENIMSKIGVPEARDLLTVLETAMDDVAFEGYRVTGGRAELLGPKGTKPGKVRMLLLDNGLASELLTKEELVNLVKKAMEEKLKYSHEHQMPTKDSTGDGIMYIPQFLKPYVQNRLEIFIENALKAILMTKGREYMIDRSSGDDSTDSPPHHFDCIVPVDFKASGVLEKNKRWGDGLQQFLELKHQLALTPLSTVTNYLSNFHFFKRYTEGSGVYGVSGTLGDKSDCAFLTKHFKVSCYPIPTHKHKKVVELPMVQVEGGEDIWIRWICQRTKAVISAKSWCEGQAALVVCEDIKIASKLQSAFIKGVCKPEKITLYTRSDKHTVEGMNFGPGHVIIATNLAGRGTNISVTKEVNKSGGLFVLLTHFPSNRRVEKQVFGRTARKGQPGAVQMVLNYHSLARAYQGQTSDIMRQLREDYERERIDNMETDELQTVNIREKLFAVFCQRLSSFTNLYGGQETQDFSSMRVCDVPVLLDSLDKTKRMDIKPAQNAFKETWAHWLILNEDRIENNDDINQLTENLTAVLDKRQREIEHGKSSNFYDHTRQALGRMYLHEADHGKDCGTLTAWNQAIEADNAYKAIALYNKSYIIINMGKKGYMDEAINLLKETIKCVDVHVAEVANTLMACHISSASGKFEAHNEGETNLKRQFEIRKTFFKLWLDSADKAVKMLQKLKDDGEDAITEETGIFALTEKPSHLEANELQELFNEGLQIMYEVKKKPRFCIDALICAIIGVLQVFAGVLICALSFGSASQVGLGFISEGVSDIISGVVGMITGTFDWAEWAISKAIGIGLSLISAGFSKIKDAVCAVAKGVKHLLTGAKSLSSVADDCIKAAKTVWKSTKTAVSSAATSLSKQSLKKTMSTLASSQMAKASVKQAGKYAVKELLTQGITQGLDVAISKGVEALFQKLLSDSFHSEVVKGFRESTEMNDCLIQLIVCTAVPETSMNAQNPNAYQIPSSNETLICRQIKTVCDRVVPELTTDNAIIIEVFSRLKEVKDEMKDILDNLDKSGKLFTAVTVVTEFAAHTTQFVTAMQNIPTSKVMKENVLPEFKEEIDSLLRDDDIPEYKSDMRSKFSTVLALKEKLIKILTEKVATAFIDACSSNLNSFLTDFARSKLNDGVTGAIDRAVKRHEKNYSFQKKQEQFHVQKQKSDSDAISTSPVSKQDLNDLTSRVQKVEVAQKAPSLVELKAMTSCEQLGGKGVEIQTIDRDGTELSTVAFRGSNSEKGAIKLRIVREDVLTDRSKSLFTKIKEKVLDSHSPWSGYFCHVSDDGKETKLETDADNSLFYAIALAINPGLSPREVSEKANALRSEVGTEIRKNPQKYVILHRRQKEYEASYGDSTFFSLPPKSSSASEKKQTKSESPLTLTRMKLTLKEKATEMWTKLVSGDETILKDILKASVSAIKNIAKPIGVDQGTETKEAEGSDGVSVTPGSPKLITKKLLYLPSRDIIKECSGRISSRFSQMSTLWTQGLFVSMVIPLECEDQILASAGGKIFGVSEKEKLYEVYRNLMVDCLCGSSEDCNPSRLLKLSMICSHPDSTLAILKTTSKLKVAAQLDVEEIAKPPELPEVKEIPEDLDPRLGKILTLDPGTGKRIEGPWGLSDDGLDTYYKICFMVSLLKYKVGNCFDEETYRHLSAWVDKDCFLDDKGQEYSDVVNACKAIG